jgi:hypothetical protein
MSQPNPGLRGGEASKQPQYLFQNITIFGSMRFHNALASASGERIFPPAQLHGSAIRAAMIFFRTDLFSFKAFLWELISISSAIRIC